jgi:hypothetical protein
MGENTMIKRVLFYIFILIIIVIGLYFLVGFMNNIGKTKVSLIINPENSQVMINGKIVKSKTVYLENGQYLISVTNRDYFEFRNTYTIDDSFSDIKIDLVEIPQTIEVLLRSNKYNEVINKHPLLERLPFNNILLDIDYDPESTIDNLVINVNSYDGYRHGVINKIKALGYNPAEYNIIFNNYENPFQL